jgi:hypothetical protein
MLLIACLPLPQPGADHTHRLPGFNRQLLAQAQALVAAHGHPDGPVYAGMVGPHLRHVIEHFEALLCRPDHAVVDYDSRRRDPDLERDPALAGERLQALQDRLARLARLADLSRPPTGVLHQAVRVRGLAGLAGEFGFSVDSTVGRELAFLASHTVHHFALIKSHCLQQGIRLPAGFGQAPATVAHAAAARAPSSTPAPASLLASSLQSQSPPCHAPLMSA